MRPLLLVCLALPSAGCVNALLHVTSSAPTPEVRAGAFPHALLTEVMAAHVTDDGFVDYEALASHREPLERYLLAVSDFSPHVRPDLFPTPAERTAYWLNAHNAYALYAVLRMSDVRRVTTRRFAETTRFLFGGVPYSLNEAARKARAGSPDPRLHVALVPAAAGFVLPREAYEPETLEAQLAAAARRFCAQAAHVQVRDGRVYLSERLARRDLGADGPVGFCRRSGRPELVSRDDHGFPDGWLGFDLRVNRASAGLRRTPTLQTARVTLAPEIHVPSAPSAISPAPDVATPPAVVVVFDLEDPSALLPLETSDQLTDYLVTRLSELRGFRVVPRSQVRERLLDAKADSYRACIDEACQIELGKALAAEKSLAPSLVRMGDKCALIATVYDLRTETTDRGASQRTPCAGEALLEGMDALAQQLSR